MSAPNRRSESEVRSGLPRTNERTNVRTERSSHLTGDTSSFVTRGRAYGIDLDHLDMTRSLAIERRQPVPTRSREQRQLDDLQEVIHILAMALTNGKTVA